MHKAPKQTQRIRRTAVLASTIVVLANGCASESEGPLEEENSAVEVRNASVPYAHCDQILSSGVFNEWDTTFNYDEYKVVVAAACNVLHKWKDSDQAAFSKECGSDADTNSVDMALKMGGKKISFDLGWGATDEKTWCATAESRQIQRESFYSQYCSSGSESYGLSEARTEVIRTADKHLVDAWSDCVVAANKANKETTLGCYGRMSEDDEGLTFNVEYTRAEALAPTVLDLEWASVNATVSTGKLNDKMGEGNIIEYFTIDDIDKTTKIIIKGSGQGDTGNVTCDYELGPVEAKVCDGPDIRGARTNRLYEQNSSLCMKPTESPPEGAGCYRHMPSHVECSDAKDVSTCTNSWPYSGNCTWKEPKPEPKPEPIPIKALSLYHSACDSGLKSREPACVWAISQFCRDQGYVGGVSQEAIMWRITVACLTGELFEIPMADLPGCDVEETQGGACMSAVHRACYELGYGGGIIQWPGGISPLALCFRPWYLGLELDELRGRHPGCDSVHLSQKAECVAAIHSACDERGFLGGISQEVGVTGFGVACFEEGELFDAPIH